MSAGLPVMIAVLATALAPGRIAIGVATGWETRIWSDAVRRSLISNDYTGSDVRAADQHRRHREAARYREILRCCDQRICGFDDFFVTTHVVAFAQDRGVDAFLAGNLLALMGLTGADRRVAAGAFIDSLQASGSPSRALADGSGSSPA